MVRIEREEQSAKMFLKAQIETWDPFANGIYGIFKIKFVQFDNMSIFLTPKKCIL